MGKGIGLSLGLVGCLCNSWGGAGLLGPPGIVVVVNGCLVEVVVSVCLVCLVVEVVVFDGLVCGEVVVVVPLYTFTKEHNSLASVTSQLRHSLSTLLI